MTTTRNFATTCVHGDPEKALGGAPHQPIFNCSTFVFDSTAELIEVVEGRELGGLYTRFGLNPTILSLERQLAHLEGAESALSFSAGMAAISALLLAHGKKGIVSLGDIYGGTLELMQKQLPSLGISTHCLLNREQDQLDSALSEGCGLLYIETPSNPTLDVLDIHVLAEIAHSHSALLVVDSTFASPVIQQPLRLGADLVMHSATKYLGGHSDLTAGALMGPTELLQPISEWRKNLGQVPSPETAALLSRSLRTLALRVEQQSCNAMAIAEALEKHQRVRRVLYPGLPEFPGHTIAQQQMAYYGGMLSFEVDGDGEAATAVIDKLQLFRNAVSLGGTESLATQPSVVTHRGIGKAERERRGIGDNMIRLSVGVEHRDDLVADLLQALSYS